MESADQALTSSGPVYPSCGGIRGTSCQGNNWCVDDPRDTCNPKKGGADCPGICVGPACGGFLAIACDAGYVCVDDPRDSCDPLKGGADCTGTCIYQGDVM